MAFFYSKMKNVVYIIQSQVTLKYYCGETENLQDRLIRHNDGRSKYTKHGAPWVLIKVIEFKSRSEARFLEKKIKGRGIKRWLIENE